MYAWLKVKHPRKQATMSDSIQKERTRKLDHQGVPILKLPDMECRKNTLNAPKKDRITKLSKHEKGSPETYRKLNGGVKQWVKNCSRELVNWKRGLKKLPRVQHR